jgi:uncharacterized membrane protein YeaQ/YmgE (transglycosylase-associated protein family)
MLIIGAIAGFLARAIVPGRDPMTVPMTILLGIVGSFVGGFLWELIQFHRFELRPIGFIGSVIGIGGALSVAGAAKVDDPDLLSNTTSAMSIAFNGTFIALLLSAVLVYILHIAQQKEETALNESAQYCLDKLINRLLDAPDKNH